MPPFLFGVIMKDNLDQQIIDYLYENCDYEKLIKFNVHTILGGRFDASDYENLNPAYCKWMIQQCIEKLVETKKVKSLYNEYLESFLVFVKTQSYIIQQYAYALMDENSIENSIENKKTVF